MNKKSKFWPWALAWFILALLSCYIRLYPLRSHRWGNAHDLMAYTPLFTYLLIIIAFLWVCRLSNFSVVASIVGALFLIMAPINLKHGSLGWYGSDPYDILFPLLLLNCLFLALRPASKKSGYLWAVIFGLTLSAYALFGRGSGLLFLMGVVCALGAAAYNFFIKKDPIHARQNLLFLVLFIGTALLMVGIRKFTHRGTDIWPDRFIAVGELKKSSFESIALSVGGPVFLLLALGGWMYNLRMALQHFRHTRAIDILIVSIFLFVTVILSLNGEQFVLFATIPLSILAAAAAHRFISLRSVGLPLAGLLIALILFNADRDIRTLPPPIKSQSSVPNNL